MPDHRAWKLACAALLLAALCGGAGAQSKDANRITLAQQKKSISPGAAPEAIQPPAGGSIQMKPGSPRAGADVSHCSCVGGTGSCQIFIRPGGGLVCLADPEGPDQCTGTCKFVKDSGGKMLLPQ